MNTGKRSRFWTVILLVFLLGFSLTAADYGSLHEEGRRLYREDRNAEALEVYNSILEEYPGDVDALLFRGRLLARMEQYEDAERDLLFVIRQAPDYLDTYYALASLYYWREELDKSRDMLTQWLARAPEDPRAHVLSARVAIADRNYAAARTFIGEAEACGAEKETVLQLLNMINLPAGTYGSELGMQYEYLAVWPQRSDWQQLQLRGGGELGALKIYAEFSPYRRYGQSDYALAADLYAVLWEKAYVNVRAQYGLTGNFLPRGDVTLELFQALGTRQEPALGYRLMHFDSLAVHIPSLAWAAYPGKWYIRDKLSMILSKTLSWQNQFTLRYFLGSADDYIQLMNVLGTDFDVLNERWMQSVAFSLGASRAVSDHVLLNAGLSWTRDINGVQRFGGSAGLIYRW